MRNPLTIEAFAEWAEKKPANEDYDFTLAWNCAVAQFLKANAVVNYELLSTEIPKAWLEPVKASPQTFGALAKRLRAAL